jgi:CubicO group peptidase (beta-lactamase class C family)
MTAASTRGLSPLLALLAIAAAATPASAGETAPSRAPSPATTSRTTPASVNREALDRLLDRARQSNSDAVVIMKDGKLVGEWHFGKAEGPIETMSATKSIVNLAVGKLIDSGKIRSLDQPIHEFFPEWRQGRKQRITVRHLLNHTSGLQNERSTMLEIYPSPDFVKLALAAELDADPGSAFSYNNKAVNLIAGLVKAASGTRLDDYLRSEIFAPMGIHDFSWDTDRAGNPHAMSGLSMRAIDLAKIGQMLLDSGTFRGKRIISSAWIAESIQPSQPLQPSCGLLWWLLLSEFRVVLADDDLIARWQKAGASAQFLERVRPLVGQVFTDRAALSAARQRAFPGEAGAELWTANTVRKGLPDGRRLPSPVVGYYADGYLGQFLVVLPRQRLVAVRQMRSPDDPNIDEQKLDAFGEFPEMVQQLVPASR